MITRECGHNIIFTDFLVGATADDMQVDLEKIPAFESLARAPGGCGEVVVLLSVIVVTFVLCDEFGVVVVAWIQSKPDRDSKSEEGNHQRDPMLEWSAQKRTSIMTLSHENVLAQTMALAPLHARHGPSLEHFLTSYWCQDALKRWLAATEWWQTEDECWEVRHECWASEETCWVIQDDCQYWKVVHAFPRQAFTCRDTNFPASKEITPADIMARWNLM